jgi:hypothetical protein
VLHHGSARSRTPRGQSHLAVEQIPKRAAEPGKRIVPLPITRPCRLHDRAFDSGLIAFDDQCRMLISRSLKKCLPQEAVHENFKKVRGHSSDHSRRRNPASSRVFALSPHERVRRLIFERLNAFRRLFSATADGFLQADIFPVRNPGVIPAPCKLWNGS